MAGRFRNIYNEFSKQKKLALVGLVGASSSLLTYAWVDSWRSRVTAEEINENITQEPKEEKQIPISSHPTNAKHIVSTGATHSISVNKKYRKVAPKLLKIIHQAKEVSGSPGISFAVSHDGELVMQGGIGLADVENNVLCTSETIMRIASISKSLTSVAIGKLLEKGLIDLDEPIQTYIPSFPEKKFDGEPVKITTKQLLSHTSGIRGYFSDKEGEEDKEKRKHGIKISKYGEKCENTREMYIKEHYKTVEDGLCLFKDDTLIYKPGTDYEYSTLAYSLVSRIIEKVSEEDYVKHMTKICKGIGIQHTKVDLNDPVIYERARSYCRKKGVLKNVAYVDNSYKWSGGGFLSNVEDLLKLGNMMLHSSQSDKGYLKLSTVNTLWKPVNKDNDYALGWGVQEVTSDMWPAFGHSGGAIGATSILAILPREESTSSSMSTKDYPKGIVIVLIANMQAAAGLREAASRINKCFNDHHLYGQFKQKLVYLQ